MLTIVVSRGQLFFGRGTKCWPQILNKLMQGAWCAEIDEIDSVLRAGAIGDIEGSRRVDAEKLQRILGFSRVGAWCQVFLT